MPTNQHTEHDSQYPEHDKLHAIKDQTQAIGEFLEWLEDEKGIRLFKDDDNYDQPQDLFVSQLDLMAEWAGIDRNKLETEKRKMLAEMRRLNDIED